MPDLNIPDSDDGRKPAPARVGVNMTGMADTIEYDEPYSPTTTPYVRADIADEMLAALKLVRDVDEGPSGADGMERSARAEDAVCAALAKAEGKE